MELQGVMLGVVIVVVSAIILYLMSMWGFREKTYEEVIAEQRRQNELALSKSKSDKDKTKKKTKFKKGKGKVEDSPVPGSASEAAAGDSEIEKMVEYELEPEIIEQTEIHTEKAVKKLKKQQPKTILLNREEKSYTRPAKEVHESFHPSHLPKDEVELMHEHQQEQREEKEKKSKKEKKAVVVEEITAAVQHNVSAAAPSEGKKKKHRVDDPLEGGLQLINAVKSAPLTEGELQSLIDVLLDRQGSSSQWMKKTQKGDPMTIMKRQLEDKEQALVDEQQLAATATSKLRELRAEFTAEKTKSSALDRRLNEKINSQSQEIQALHLRMKSSHDQHAAEMNSLKASASQPQYDPAQAAMVQRVTDENRHYQETLHGAQQEVNNLKGQLQIIQNELSNNVRNLSAADSARKSAEQKAAMKDDQMKRMEQSKDEITKQMHQLELRANALAKEKDTIAAQKQQTENECANIKNKLNNLEASGSGAAKDAETKVMEAEKARTELQSQIKSASDQLAAMKNQESEKDSEIAKLKQENQRLSGELNVAQEQKVQAAPASVNGDIHAEDASQEKLNASQKEVEQLKASTQTLTTQLDKVNEDLEAQRKKNNDLETQVSSLSAQQASASELDQMKSNLAAKDSELSQVRTECDGKASELGQVASELSSLKSSTQEELARLRVDLKSGDAAKNKMAAELETAKQALDSKVKELQSELEKTVGEMTKQSQELEVMRQQSNSKDSDDTSLRLDLENRLEELKAANAELQTLKKDNADLRQKNTVAMEALQKAEQANKKDSSSDDAVYKEVLVRLFPEVPSGDIKAFEVGATDYLKQLQSQVSDSQQQESVEHYKTVLATTEDMLNKLQNSVESEEKKWQGRLQQSEDEHKKTQVDLASVREEMKALRGSTEMEDRIKELEKRLQTVEKEKQDSESSLQKQVADAKAQLEKEGKSSEETIQKLRGELNEKSKPEETRSSPEVEEEFASSPAKAGDVGTSV